MLSIDDRRPWPPCPAPFNLAAHVLAAGGGLPDKIGAADPAARGRRTLELCAADRRGARARAPACWRWACSPATGCCCGLGNEPAFPVAFLGAIAAGLVPVPTSAQLTAAEITGWRARIAPRADRGGPGMALPDPLPCPVLTAAGLLAMERLPPCAWAMGDPDRLAYIVFTSGTSGQPRAVLHAHRAIWARRHDARGLGRAEASGPRCCMPVRCNWTYTLGTGLLDPWAVGATALMPGGGDGAGADCRCC